MKIAYLFHENAADPSIQSGRPQSILHEFEQLGAEVDRIFPLHTSPSPATLAKKVGYRLMGKLYRGDRDNSYLDGLAARFDQLTVGKSYDIVFCPGTEAISHLKTNIPITFCSDATFANLVDYYWDFTDLPEEYVRKGHAQEQAALANAALAVYSSDWAAKSAINDYGADPSKVVVIPFGANNGRYNDLSSITAAIEARPTDRIRLLFVGRHWERKGGELVVATALCLMAHGHPVTLDIVGCDVPAEYHDVPWIFRHGLLNQRVPEDMQKLHELFSSSHFVFVPSRAEAFGLTFAEANAYGLPAIPTNTGGIPGVVTHGVNGLLLDLPAKPSDYADAIVSVFADPARYRAMCHDSFREFQTRLNWRVFTQRFLEIAEQRFGSRASDTLANRIAATA